MNNYNIREIKRTEIPILSEFLYEAIFQPNDQYLLPRDVIQKPELQVFIEDFGRKDDYCLIAECDEKIIGAVWSRILAGTIKGYGNVDGTTPELAISLYQEYRNRGIGTELMKRMMHLLKSSGYAQVSLAVQKDNYALRMYQAMGFSIIEELEQEYLMLCQLMDDFDRVRSI
ncbi:GNAT family N-acetyltransferase [Acetobacterium woodii]|uniref:Acetyltransferase GNAT family n=1 Tax=Acetobacterium woodii (strain ATCC 29683 / DSM 1030 / JCM 2381 / KCTC 1655 / WB1) TaxID=931626 RepID=H6LGP2_ACEWD|nr:GNAT family N-acetyltransferase [Acetobacterium woodii]AFA48370.1 acetyltransferase GNAT family [Acetobacterium woodii DSM 1030]